MYVVYGDELARRAVAPEYMSPTSLTRLVHKDSSQNNLLVQIIKNMGIDRKTKTQSSRYSSFSNFIEGEWVDKIQENEHNVTLEEIICFVHGKEKRKKM